MKLLLEQQRIDKEDCDKELAQMRGNFTGLEQHLLSLQNILRRNGIEVPTYRPPEVVFLPKPKEKD